MTKEEIVILYKNLSKLDGLIGAKFAYFVGRNKSLIEPEIKAIEATLKPTKDFIAYEEERIDLAKKNAEIDPTTKKPKTKVNQQKQTEYAMKDPAGWAKIFEALNKKHKKTLDQRAKQIDEYNNLLLENSDVKLFRIKFEHIPTNISVAQMNVIVDLIDDTK